MHYMSSEYKRNQVICLSCEAKHRKHDLVIHVLFCVSLFEQVFEQVNKYCRIMELSFQITFLLSIYSKIEQKQTNLEVKSTNIQFAKDVSS